MKLGQCLGRGKKGPDRSVRGSTGENRRGIRVLAAGQILLVLALLLAARVAGGETLGYFTSAQVIAGNTLGAATAFSPSGLSAVPAGDGTISLHWDGVGWASGGYQIARATRASGPFQQIGTVSSATRAFVDTPANGLIPGETYSYVVRGVSGRGGTGYPSAVVSATSRAATPTVVLTLPAAGATEVALSPTVPITFSTPVAAILPASPTVLPSPAAP